MTVAEATLCLAIFNSLAVPLLVSAWGWTRRVDRRLTRLERKADLDPLTTT